MLYKIISNVSIMINFTSHCISLIIQFSSLFHSTTNPFKTAFKRVIFTVQRKGTRFMFKHLLHQSHTSQNVTKDGRKDRLPRIWKVAGKTIDFS